MLLSQLQGNTVLNRIISMDDKLVGMQEKYTIPAFPKRD
jgi:hypothetical protein